MGILASPWHLKRLGVLSMNRRNADYVQGCNKRYLYPLVDDKVQTKQLAMRAGIPVPPQYGVIAHNYQLKKLSSMLEPHDQFVIKPSKGSGGSGIQVITGRDGDYWVKGSGKVIAEEVLERHVSNILSGLYSLGGQNDIAMIEYRIVPNEHLGELSYQGVPDIRIVLFHGYPAMAMLRLATHFSDGKANLHQGAVGVGIRIPDGAAVKAVWRNQAVELHPDNGRPFSEIRIPDWRNLLVMAARCYDATRLGYLGVDLVVDRDKGPLLLEMNARPGLAIQIANNTGLRPRLEAIQKRSKTHAETAEQRVSWSCEQFA